MGGADMLFSQVNELIEIQEEFMELNKQHYFDQVLFSYQWWLLLAILVILWTIWGFFVDKERLNQILLIGLVTSLLAFIFDDVGRSLNLWFYPHQLSFFSYHLYSVDIGIVPVFYMLLFQYARTWKAYLITLILLSVFAAFIAEPLFVWMDIYVLLNWNHLISFPFYILMGVFVKWLVNLVTKMTNTKKN